MSDFFLGCDASKGYADFIVLDEREEIVERVFQLDDTFEGHGTLSDFLMRFLKGREGAKLYAGIESTGGYENNWYALLLRLGEVLAIKTARLNPLPVKRHHEASMRRNITDAISAYNIASYLIAYPKQIRYEEDASFRALRKQWNLTKLCTKQKTQLANQLGFLVYQSNPGLVRYCKDGMPAWALDVLSRYPTAPRLAKARVKALAKISYLSQEKASQLIEEASCSIASATDETDAFTIQEAVRQIQSLTESIAAQKKHMAQICAIPEVNQLSSIQGIGTHSAIGLMINIISAERFSSAKKLVSYFGLHPLYQQSGDGTCGVHMSKKGRSEPRAILYMVVLSALNCNPVIKQLYARCIANGMGSLEAIGVCMHKMLRIIYGMLVSKTQFDPKMDEKNRKTFVKRPEQKSVDKKRRFQDPDGNAPISRRQTKTREQKTEGNRMPQGNLVPVNEVLQSLPANQNTKCDARPFNSGNGNGPVAIAKLINIQLVEIAEMVGHKEKKL